MSLRQRFGDAVDAQVEQRIATALLEQVEAWTGRVLSAAPLAAAASARPPLRRESALSDRHVRQASLGEEDE